MNTFSQAKIRDITWKLFEKRKRITENMDLRRKMVAASYHMQVQNDRRAVQSHIAHLQAGPRRAYLERRLAEINQPR
jgi:hypothetical protein